MDQDDKTYLIGKRIKKRRVFIKKELK